MTPKTAVFISADGTKTIIPLMVGAPMSPPNVVHIPEIRPMRQSPGRAKESSLAKYRKK